MNSDTNPKLLYAFYDFAVAPVSFDIVAFLVEAERVRRSQNLDGIHVVIVPIAPDGKRLEDLYSKTHETWRLDQIVVPACGLLASVRGLTICASREQAAPILALGGKIHPDRYTLEHPVAHHHLGWVITHAHLGADMQAIKASTQARTYARQWIEARAHGRKVVAITLREARFTSKRNSDVNEWLRFARMLDAAGYFPVILRDTDFALDPPPEEFSGLALFPEATFNLDLRIAFYEEAHICAFVSNGPASVCFFDRDVRYLYFVSGEFLEGDPPTMMRVGIAVDTTPPFCNAYQHWIWHGQDADRLMAEFVALERDLNADRADGSYERKLAPLAFLREPPHVVADRMRLWARKHGSIDDWEIVAILREAAPGLLYGDLNFTLEQARINFTGHRFEQAIDLYRFLVVKEPSEDIYVEFGLVYEALDRYEDARALYIEASHRFPGSFLVLFRLRLAEAACGNTDMAIAFLKGLIDRGVNAKPLFVELANIYEKLGDIENARAVYQSAISRGVGDPTFVLKLRRLSETDMRSR